MEILQKNKNIIIAFILVLIIIAGLILFVANPLHQKVQSRKDEVEQNKLKLENIKEEGDRWQEYREQRENIEKNEELLKDSSVSSGRQIDLIKKLEEIAQEEGVLIDIQNQETKDDKKNAKKTNDKEKEVDANADVDEVVFLLNLEGEYNEILDYLYKLENLNYILNISSVNIKTLSAGPILRNQAQEEEGKEKKSLQAEIIISFTPHDD